MTVSYNPPYDPAKPALRMVVVYDDGLESDPGYVLLAHNLARFDADKLAKRLRDQYDLDAHVVLHKVPHQGLASECEACEMLMDDCLQRALEEAAEVGTVIITPPTPDDGSGTMLA